MEFDSDMTDILNIKLAILELCPVAISGKSNGMKSIFAFESWISRVFTLLNSSEECLKCLVKLPKNIDATLTIDLSNSFINLSNLCKSTTLIIEADRFSPLLPANNPMFKGAIIEKAGRIKELIQAGFLSSICEKPVLKGFSHFLRSLSQYGDLQCGHIMTSVLRGIHLCPQRLQDSF